MQPDNWNNPYGYKSGDVDRGMTYYPAPQSNSTMVSDSVEMTKRLKRFVPKSSVMKGRVPERDLMTPEQLEEESNEGNDYKAKFR